jgi:hypothetical protein
MQVEIKSVEDAFCETGDVGCAESVETTEKPCGMQTRERSFVRPGYFRSGVCIMDSRKSWVAGHSFQETSPDAIPTSELDENSVN